MVGYCTRQSVHDDCECANSPTDDDNISLSVYITVSVVYTASAPNGFYFVLFVIYHLFSMNNMALL